MDDRAIVERCVARVEAHRDQLIVGAAGADAAQRECSLRIPWQKATAKRRREILVPEGIPPQYARPIRSHHPRMRMVRHMNFQVCKIEVSQASSGL
jgi:hypothetical protein